MDIAYINYPNRCIAMGESPRVQELPPPLGFFIQLSRFSSKQRVYYVKLFESNYFSSCSSSNFLSVWKKITG